MHPSHPVVSSLVFVVDPVEFFIRAVLKAVLGDPLVSIAAALSQDPGHNLDFPQVNLQPLSVVLKLGEPRTPAEPRRETGTSAADLQHMLSDSTIYYLRANLLHPVGCNNAASQNVLSHK